METEPAGPEPESASGNLSPTLGAIAGILAEAAADCAALQEDLSTLRQAPHLPPAAVVALQRIDRVQQVLEDLAQLHRHMASELRRGPGAVPSGPELAAPLRLQHLREGIAGAGDGTPPPHPPGDMELL